MLQYTYRAGGACDGIKTFFRFALFTFKRQTFRIQIKIEKQSSKVFSFLLGLLKI